VTWQVIRTPAFVTWLDKLRDRRARAVIAQRITRLAAGQIGDFKAVGECVNELRIDHGPGYRVYFVRSGQTVIVLLCGGDKSSQTRDIARAKALAKDI
jgi:putative addiction module killer protein